LCSKWQFSSVFKENIVKKVKELKELRKMKVDFEKLKIYYDYTYYVL